MARRFHETRRERTSRFVQVGQDMVLKANNYEVTASSYKFGDDAPVKIAKKSTNRQVSFFYLLVFFFENSFFCCVLGNGERQQESMKE